MSEMILTALALIACWAFICFHSVPMLLEWLEAMNTDDTTFDEED